MSETKVPPEFEWIKPGVQAVYNSKTHPVFGRIMMFLDYPKLRKHFLNPQALSNWVVSVDWFGVNDPEYCLNFDRTDVITLTLTRFQAEMLSSLLSPERGETIEYFNEIHNLIEEKLK